MSALARLLYSRGVEVSGSDVSLGEEVKRLRGEGIIVKIGQDISLIPHNTEVVVYSNALKKYEPEFIKKLAECLWQVWSYPELLGEVSKGMKTIAISGTHGKTTTTSMVATVLLDLGLDPTVIVGGTLVRERTNFIAGKSGYLVVEADEYERAFHNYYPYILIITNIDLDHLDYYKDLADIQASFREVASRVPKDGKVICNSSDPHIVPVVAGLEVTDYTKVSQDGLALKFPGAHMRTNAQAVLTLGEFLGLPRNKVIESLNNWSGTERRFEYKGETEAGAMVFDDYAHNPEKVRAAIAGTREMFPHKKIVAVFQPHLYSRTKKLFTELASSFGEANEVLVLPIFPSREKLDPTITSEMLTEAISKTGKNVRCVEDFESASEYVKQLGEEVIILTIGAGDINKLSQALVG